MPHEAQTFTVVEVTYIPKEFVAVAVIGKEFPASPFHLNVNNGTTLIKRHTLPKGKRNHNKRGNQTIGKYRSHTPSSLKIGLNFTALF
jgi:hypothetical protein